MFAQGNRELNKMDDKNRDLRVVEALLFASKGPLSELQLAEYLDGGANLNCSEWYFDGNCVDNFENCSPDCPVGILELKSSSNFFFSN